MSRTLSLTPRLLQPDTPLQGQAVTIMPPRDASAEQTAQLEARLGQWGATVTVVTPNGDSLKAIAGPVIVWGNLGNNDAVRELYFRFLLATDCRYPGPGGYELRTLMNPLGTGANIIHLGYSEAEGLAAGWTRLLEQLAPVTPRLAEVKATQLPLAGFMVEAIRTADFPPLDWMLPASNHNTFKGYLGYLDGDAGLIAQYQEVWRRMLAYGIPDGDHNIKDLHLRTSMLISSFRLLETVGLIDDELRGPILNYFVTWINSDQGVKRLDHEGNTVPGVQRQNHGTIPALALSYFAAYLRDFYPEIKEEPAEWEALSDKVFSVYWDGSWKPASEGLCHGWYLEQPVLLEYGLLDAQHRFFTQDGARRAADCAVAVVNNAGWMPGSGDAHLLRSFPGETLRTAAAWYRNEEYHFVDLLASDHRRLRSHVFLPRAFDIGVQGKQPPSGLTVVPLDPLVHGAATHSPKAAPWMFKVPPAAPVEDCFDKVAFRQGWKPDDAYLLIDGIGGGSHSYPDALDLIEYSRLGHSFLISDTGTLYPEPDSHAIVTVARDGICDPIPCFGECDEATWNESTGTGYARLVLRGNNGGTWTRELFFQGDHGLVIHDHVCATEDGDFTIQCNLRIPGKVVHEAGRTEARRKHASGDGEVIFTLQSTVPEGASLRIVEHDQSGQIRHVADHENPPEEDDVVVAWARRYGTADKVISVVRSRIHTRLKKGEAVSFVHYAHARRGDETASAMRVTGDRDLVLTGFEQSVALRSHFNFGFAPPLAVLTGEGCPIWGSSRVMTELLTGSVKKLIPAADGGTIVVMSAGRVVSLAADWSVRWEQVIAGPIHDADADTERLYVGHDATSLSAYALNDGAKLWQQDITRIPSSCPWWEWFSSAVLRVVAARPQSGFTGVIVGCGDLHVRSFTTAGECRWAFRYMNGVPGTIGLMDVDGDGVDEIIAGGEVMSNRAECRVVKADGSLLQQMDVEWWTSRMTAQARSESDGQQLAFGANWGRNLHFVTVDSSHPREPLHKAWLKNLPGSTTDIVIDATSRRLLVGNNMGLVYCFAFDGTQTGRLALPAGVTKLIRIGSQFLVGLEDTTAYVVHADEAGQLHLDGAWVSQGDWAKAVAVGEELLMPTTRGIARESLNAPNLR